MDLQRTPRPPKAPARYPNRIRDYRIKGGLNQRQLAKRVGRALSMVALWERGRRLPSAPNLFRLAKALNTFAEALYPVLYEAARNPEQPKP